MEPPRERDRLEIVAGGDAATAAVVPPTAEESVSVPERWRVYFETGLSLEIRARGGARNRGLLRRAGDRLALWRADWSRVARGGVGRAWLRVELDPAAAAALYRSLPPDVSLILVTGASP
jgi:hypothetical protein